MPLYLVTSPGCIRCTERKAALLEAGRDFLEVDAETLFAGSELGLSLTVRAILLAEVTLLEGNLPVEMELP
jgi:hypothetical protein